MFVADAIRAYDSILKSDPNPGKNGINFGTGSEISINDVAKLIIEKCHMNSNKIKPIHVEARPVEVTRLFADIKKAKELLKFTPAITFQNGVEQMVDWYTNYKSEMWEY
jgi:nucleoside-diphosphate-sugar epimerase